VWVNVKLRPNKIINVFLVINRKIELGGVDFFIDFFQFDTTSFVLIEKKNPIKLNHCRVDFFYKVGSGYLKQGYFFLGLREGQ